MALQASALEFGYGNRRIGFRFLPRVRRSFPLFSARPYSLKNFNSLT
jgi:hypothetical protein